MLNSRQAFQKKEASNLLVSASSSSNTYYNLKAIQKLQNNSVSSVSVSEHVTSGGGLKQAISEEPIRD